MKALIFVLFVGCAQGDTSCLSKKQHEVKCVDGALYTRLATVWVATDPPTRCLPLEAEKP